MDKQQATINELHVGIFTFMITLYQQYKLLLPPDEARAKVIEYVRGLADYFEIHETNNTDN